MDALIFGVAYVGAIGVVLVHAIQGLATPGDVILTVGLAAGMNNIVSTAVGYGTHFLSVLRVARRYLWLVNYAAGVRETATDPVPVPVCLSGGIEIQDLSFHYPGTQSPVLADVSLCLPGGTGTGYTPSCIGFNPRHTASRSRSARLVTQRKTTPSPPAG